MKFLAYTLLCLITAGILSGCAAPPDIPGSENERPDIGSIAARSNEGDQ